MAWVFLYFRYLYTIRPDAVYRKALVQLNTNPGILEVTGCPSRAINSHMVLMAVNSSCSLYHIGQKAIDTIDNSFYDPKGTFSRVRTGH